jgi:hypothetical protein
LKAKLVGRLGGTRDVDLDILQGIVFLAAERPCHEGCHAELHELAERYRRLPYDHNDKVRDKDVARFNAELARILDKINQASASA